MDKFKVGDRVRRIASEYNGMKIGDEDVIRNIESGGRDLVLTKYNIGDTNGHSAKNFILIKEVNLISNIQIW